MSFKTRTCFEIVCDGGCIDPWDGEDGGVPHFDTAQKATEYAEYRGWLVADGRALCSHCAAKATCEATGHQWDEWYDVSRDGVEARQRSCDRCGESDYDPPFEVLYPKFQALRDAEEIVRAAAAGAGEPS
ncbi:hypothetical protein [Micromonospora sp. NPDC050695]|uniref:hypothetical protein n=1 Tax=Micromonospora sp. NPDC050695 TaxID=3154938 RepID=UPI003404C1B5